MPKLKLPFNFPDYITSRESKIKWLKSVIKYEKHKGIHTYHMCSYCEENRTRAGRCYKCLEDDLEEVEKGT